MKQKVAILVALILTFSAVLNISSVYASKNSDQLSKIKNSIKQKNGQLKVGQSREKALATQVADLEIQIGVAENAMVSIQNHINSTQKKVAKAQVNLQKAEDNVQTQNRNLDARLRNMYEAGSIGFLDVILKSASISDLFDNVDMVQKIFSSDESVLGTLQKEYSAVQQKKDALVALENTLQAAKNQQVQKQAELTASKSELAQKKAVVMAGNKKLQAGIENLSAEADRIQSIINGDKTKGNEVYKGGIFTWPVPGYHTITSNYGWRYIFGGYEFHTGIDIAAPYGVHVVAAASGTIIFAGYLGSYGNAVIISHGSHLYTLYGHNSSIIAYVGENVAKGQAISRIGATGDATGNHCHFEVRKGSNLRSDSVSPWNYL